MMYSTLCTCYMLCTCYDKDKMRMIEPFLSIFSSVLLLEISFSSTVKICLKTEIINSPKIYMSFKLPGIRM